MEAVAAEHEGAARAVFDIEHAAIDAELTAPDRVREHMGVGELFGDFDRDEVLVDHPLHAGVILGAPLEGALLEFVDAAVAAVGVPDGAAVGGQRDNGGAHAGELRLGHAGCLDQAVALFDAALEGLVGREPAPLGGVAAEDGVAHGTRCTRTAPFATHAVAYDEDGFAARGARPQQANRVFLPGATAQEDAGDMLKGDVAERLPVVGLIGDTRPVTLRSLRVVHASPATK